jgi:hypothetical protein
VLVVLIRLVVVGIAPINVMFCEEVSGADGVDAAVFGKVAWRCSVCAHVPLEVLLELPRALLLQIVYVLLLFVVVLPAMGHVPRLYWEGLLERRGAHELRPIVVSVCEGVLSVVCASFVVKCSLGARRLHWWVLPVFLSGFRTGCVGRITC